MLCGPLYTPTVHALSYTDSLHNCLVWPPRPLTHWAAIRQAEYVVPLDIVMTPSHEIDCWINSNALETATSLSAAKTPAKF